MSLCVGRIAPRRPLALSAASAGLARAREIEVRHRSNMRWSRVSRLLLARRDHRVHPSFLRSLPLSLPRFATARFRGRCVERAFLMLTHPDFFGRAELADARAVNSRNLRALRYHLGGGASSATTATCARDGDGSAAASVRLAFYLKATNLVMTCRVRIASLNHQNATDVCCCSTSRARWRRRPGDDGGQRRRRSRRRWPRGRCGRRGGRRPGTRACRARPRPARRAALDPLNPRREIGRASL